MSEQQEVTLKLPKKLNDLLGKYIDLNITEDTLRAIYEELVAYLKDKIDIDYLDFDIVFEQEAGKVRIQPMSLRTAYLFTGLFRPEERINIEEAEEIPNEAEEYEFSDGTKVSFDKEQGNLVINR